jgi:hypothetical protein
MPIIFPLLCPSNFPMPLEWRNFINKAFKKEVQRG